MKRILFHHIPKCGGSTIQSYLRKHYPQKVIFLTDGFTPMQSVKYFKFLPEAGRHSYYLIAGHRTHELLNYVHPETIKLVCFRDPVDRIISHYFYVKQNKNHYLHDRVVKSEIKLKDYASLSLSGELRNLYTTYFSGFSIQEAELKPELSVYLAAKTILEQYNIIGFQDNLPELVKKIRNLAHLNQPFINQFINKSASRPRLKEIDENAKKEIAKVNFMDIQLYKLLKDYLEGR